MPAREKHPICTIHKDRIWLTLCLDQKANKKKVKNTKISSKLLLLNIVTMKGTKSPTSCGEHWKTCSTQSNSWQYVDWGSKHGWSTAEEEKREVRRNSRSFFHNFPQSPHCAMNCPPTCRPKWLESNCTPIKCNTLGVYHQQYVVCHIVQRDSSAIKFERVRITFIFALFHWLKL